MLKFTEEEINTAKNDAYKKAGYNAYFGNGFTAGVNFVLSKLKNKIGSCEICRKDIQIVFCCSGVGCGCLGMPISPPVCSSKCEAEYMRRLGEQRAKNKLQKIKTNEQQTR